VSQSPEDYCRRVEAYLCRKNDGHLVRIVGPAFECVTGWSRRGVPLSVACAGIDRYFERYYAKGPRRRPVRVEFCEADVLDAFDEWRRAVGVSARHAAPEHPDEAKDSSEQTARAHASLPAHLDRVVARLVALRAGPGTALDDVLDAVMRELDFVRSRAKGLRGDARQAVLEQLRQLDGALLAAARAQSSTATLAELTVDADRELAPFKDRMPSAALERARHAAVDRLLRDRWRLPVLTLD
jgi:hypothetical protein